jgi:signal transduction histidine kinase
LAILEERNRLARELHDSVTQSLYGLVVFAGAGQEVLEVGGVDQAQRHLDRIEDAAQQALKEMRLLVYELRPPALKDEGLVGALRQRLDAVEGRAEIAIDLQVDGLVDLPASIEEGLFRIAQEALNNALKHAAASLVTVRIGEIDGRVELEVKDDGVGFVLDAVRDKGGLGLASMRERAEQLGGQLQVQSAPGKGTTVRIRLVPADSSLKLTGVSS